VLDNVKNEDIWEDTLNKFKEGIGLSITKYITRYEQEIQEMYPKRLQPAWNYYSFFFSKACPLLAFSLSRFLNFSTSHFLDISISRYLDF
jgi:hypothetical protein